MTKENPINAIENNKYLEATEAIFNHLEEVDYLFSRPSKKGKLAIAAILRETLGDDSEKDQRIALLKSNLANSEFQREELCRKVDRVEAENAKLLEKFEWLARHSEGRCICKDLRDFNDNILNAVGKEK